MAFTITFKDSVSFAVQLADKLGWRMTHSTENADYVNSVITWALHKICVERQVEMILITSLPVDDLPNVVKMYSTYIIDAALIPQVDIEAFLEKVKFRAESYKKLKPGPNRQSFEEAHKATLKQYHDALAALAAA